MNTRFNSKIPKEKHVLIKRISKLVLAFSAALMVVACTTPPKGTPISIYTDPVSIDSKFAASNKTVHIPTGGVSVNGIVFLAAGQGPHPTMVLLHGVPGNEKNLDLAQAVRRSGWNVLTLNYRGSWGSPGAYTFAGNVDDAKAALAFIREPKNAAQYRVDTGKVVLAGHSMGGWVTALVASQDKALAGALLISAANMGGTAVVSQDRKKTVEFMADNYETLSGTSPELMADEVIKNQKRYEMISYAPRLIDVPMLVVTSDDPFAPDDERLVSSIVGNGGTKITKYHISTGHNYADKRIDLESKVITWLNGL